jgi:uncharacterized short protein YbdD (DUF466 family)
VSEAASATPGLMAELGRAGRYMAQSFRLMVGVPDYGSYLAHMAATHPDEAPMSYEAFFRNRLEARYGSGPGRMGRCC